MIWGQSRCHVLGVKGDRRSNLKNQDFQILIADLDSLQKSIKRKCASFFHFIMKTYSNSASKSQKEDHFAIILFCKESKSAIRTKKFWFEKFDLTWPLTQIVEWKKLSDFFETYISWNNFQWRIHRRFPIDATIIRIGKKGV